MNPKVTVLMPVLNGEKYLCESIESILSQSYSDFEFLIINDGSTDNSREIINSFSDKRIRLVNNEKNIGQANSLNIGINMAKGEYIVRMDADDISLTDRIKEQIEYMDKNPMIGLSGTWAKIIGDNIEYFWFLPTDPDIVKTALLNHPSLIHPTVIMRKKLLIDNNLYYDESCETAEDYDLWVRASMVFPISNLGKVLLLYRMHPKQISSKHGSRQNQVVNSVRLNLLKKLDIYPNNEEFSTHKLLTDIHKLDTKEGILKVQAWLDKLNKANKKKKLYDEQIFTKYIADKWFQVCTRASQFGVWTIKTYLSSEFSRSNQVGLWQKIKLSIKCAIKYKSL